jgi:hypothetical protein
MLFKIMNGERSVVVPPDMGQIFSHFAGSRVVRER